VIAAALKAAPDRQQRDILAQRSRTAQLDLQLNQRRGFATVYRA
jgi:hypothetical protein